MDCQRLVAELTVSSGTSGRCSLAASRPMMFAVTAAVVEERPFPTEAHRFPRPTAIARPLTAFM